MPGERPVAAVTGDEMHRPGNIAMRQRQLQAGGGGARGGHAGYDLHRHAGEAQTVQFLPAAAEHERVAALQPHDMRALLGMLHDQAVDGGLVHRMPAAAFADIDAAGMLGREVQDRRVDQRVEQHHIGGLQRLDGAQCQEIGGAGAGADQARASRGFIRLACGHRAGSPRPRGCRSRNWFRRAGPRRYR